MKMFFMLTVLCVLSDFSEELKNSLMMVEWPKYVGVLLRNFK